VTWRTSVSQSAAAARLTDVNQYVQPAAGGYQAPIDVFYAAAQEIFRVGTPSFLKANDGMGALLLVGLVSTTENYFRDAFARIVRLCPVSRAAAADENIRLGSVIWHGGEEPERGAFEHMSFARAKNIIDTAKKFLDLQLTRTPILEEFDKVCELRHGIVHSSGMLAGKNAIKLQVASSKTPLRIQIGYPELQECGAVCTSLVISLNGLLFTSLAKRWATEWPKLPSWKASERHRLFKEIWVTFHSQRDATNGAIPNPLSLVRCRNAVAAEYK
jgi:hypothetical protein